MLLSDSCSVGRCGRVVGLFAAISSQDWFGDAGESKPKKDGKGMADTSQGFSGNQWKLARRDRTLRGEAVKEDVAVIF